MLVNKDFMLYNIPDYKQVNINPVHI